MHRLLVLILLGALTLALGGRAEAVAAVDQVTTTAANGPYGPGDPIEIDVEFSAPITLTGTPQLVLNVAGGLPVNCNTAASTATTLVFDYTVNLGDTSDLLDVLNASSLELNGSSIIDTASSSPALLGLPFGPTTPFSLSNQHFLVIEQNATDASVLSISGLQPDGSYGLHSLLQLTVTFDEPVFINALGTPPSLTLSSSGSATATYAGGSGSRTLVFDYTPKTGDSATSLDAVALLNFQTILDAIPGGLSAAPIPMGSTAGALDQRNYTILTTAPMIQQVYTTPLDATYGIGGVVPIFVVFTRSVNVVGTPTITLATTPSTVVNFSGFINNQSGPSTTLQFNYVVGGGQNASVLDYITTLQGIAFSANGGTIRDVATNDADLIDAPAPGTANSLGASGVTITTTPPTISQIDTTEPTGTFGPGQQVHILVSFGGLAGHSATPVNVLVSGGTPTLQLNTPTNRVATYIGGSGTAVLDFLYTVQPGDSAAPLDYTATLALQANGATIQDAVGNHANTLLPLPASTGPGGDGLFAKNLIIATPPAVTAITSSLVQNGIPAKAGTVIPITVTFSQPVVVTGTPVITLNASQNAATDAAVLISGSGTATLTFNYTVQPNDAASPLDEASSSALVNSSGGSILSMSTNAPATLALPATGATSSLGLASGILVDGVAPTVASVTAAPTTGTYGVNQVIHLSVVMSKPVTVSGAPLLQLNFNTQNNAPALAIGAGVVTPAAAIPFSYTVVANDRTSHLDQSGPSALTLNGATITDLAGNVAVLTLPAAPHNLGSTAAIAIDTSTPSVVSYLSAPAGHTYGPGQVVPISVLFTEAVTVSTTNGTPTLALSTGGAASYSSGSGTSSLLFTYTVLAGDPAGPLTAASGAALALNNGTIQNAAGTSAALALPTTTSDTLAGSNITLDTVPAQILTVSSSAPDGIYGLSSVIPITITFNNVITVGNGGVPTLALDTTVNQGVATYASGSGSATLVFSYTVQNGQNTNVLDCASTSALAANGASITDQFGIPANLTLPVGLTTGSLALDDSISIESVAPTNPPEVISITTPVASRKYDTGTTIPLFVEYSSPVQVVGTRRRSSSTTWDRAASCPWPPTPLAAAPTCSNSTTPSRPVRPLRSWMCCPSTRCSCPAGRRSPIPSSRRPTPCRRRAARTPSAPPLRCRSIRIRSPPPVSSCLRTWSAMPPARRGAVSAAGLGCCSVCCSGASAGHAATAPWSAIRPDLADPPDLAVGLHRRCRRA